MLSNSFNPEEEYSATEKKLIAIISPHWYSVIHQTDINPIALYNILAVDAFIADKKGPEIDALRRVCKAIKSCKVFRHTPEFDELCKW